jgi:hypothetical protein
MRTYPARFRYKGMIVSEERLKRLKAKERAKRRHMKLSTNHEYAFIDAKGKIYIQSAEVVARPHETIETKVWINIQNYIESDGIKKKKISVKGFNKLGLVILGRL